MNQQQFQKRRERAENEPLVITQTDDGFRVYSPANPGQSYLVSGDPEAPRCTCPDFEFHQADPQWRCKHILAALGQLNKPREQPNQGDAYQNEERLAIQNEGRLTDSEATHMVIKRSVSPDGRIDSLSIEFSCPVENATVKEIRCRALKTLDMQSQIVESFLGHDGKQNGSRSGDANNGEIPRPARMLAIGGMTTKWGRRLFINVATNGQTLRLFGNRKQLADAIVAAGYPSLAERIEEGIQLNASCRITTKPSDDGKYMNIERVLPAETSGFQRRARA